MGGKRQANVLSALITNFDTAERAIQASANSAGSALRENEKYLDSIQGRIDIFTNSVQNMWKNLIDSDVVKGIVDIGTGLVNALDAVSPLTVAFVGLFATLEKKYHLLSNIFMPAKTGIEQLKEELKRAENDLSKAKTQKAKDEAQKRVNNLQESIRQADTTAAEIVTDPVVKEVQGVNQNLDEISNTLNSIEENLKNPDTDESYKDDESSKEKSQEDDNEETVKEKVIEVIETSENDSDDGAKEIEEKTEAVQNLADATEEASDAEANFAEVQNESAQATNLDSNATQLNTMENQANAASSNDSAVAEAVDASATNADVAAEVADTAATNAGTVADANAAVATNTKTAATWADVWAELTRAGATGKSVAATLNQVVATKLANSAFIKNAIALGLATEAQVANMTATQLLGLGFKGLALSIGRATIALVKFLAATPIGWFIIIAGAITAIVSIISAVTKSTEELAEELDDLKSGLQDIRSELDSVNTELKTTQDRMAELLALPSLSFTEQEELDRLREQNEELERKKRLLESQEKRERERVAEKAAEVVNSKLSETSYNGDFWTGAGSILAGAGGGAGIGAGIGAALSLATGPFAAVLAPTLAGVGAAIGGAIGGTAMGITEFAANRISTEDKLNEEIESYEGLLSKRAELENKLANASDEGTGLFGWGKSEYDQTNEELAELEKQIDETKTYIDTTLGELGSTLEGVEYGDGADEALDKYYNALYKWEIEFGTIGAKSDGLSHIFGRPEHEALKEGIDDYIASLKDGESASREEIESIISNNEALVADIKAMGLEISDAVDYFTIDGSGLSADIIANYEKGLNALSKFKENGQIEFINDDGTVSNIGFDNLFDSEGQILSGQISKIMQGADETTRQEFEKLMSAVKDGRYNVEDEFGNISVDWDAVTKSWNISGGLRVIAEEMEKLSEINIEVFPGLEDEINGIIDSFDELISAVGHTVTAMDTLEQARAEEAYSGSVSLETLEQLMQSTDNYADLIEVDETGAIKLAANAQDILVQEKIDTIKKNAELALSTAQMQLAEAKHNQQIYTESSPAQEALRSALSEVGGAAAFVTSLWNDIISGNWDGAWERAKTARSDAITTKKNEWESQATQAATSVSEAEKAVADAEKMKSIADGLTVENIKERFDSNTASGGTDNVDDAVESYWDKLVKKYENRIALLTNERNLIEAEIEQAEARGGKAASQYYTDLINNSNAEKDILDEQYTALKAYLDENQNIFDQDQWTEYNNKLNEVAAAIKECETNTIEWAKALREIDTHYFDQTMASISQLSDEIDFVHSLLEDEEVVDENGNWSEASIVRLGLYTQQMEKAAAEAQLYQERIDKLNEQYENGELSAEEYQSSLSDLVGGQRDAIQSYEDAKDGIVSLNEARVDAINEGINNGIDGIEYEIDAYEELIDIKKKALDAERDLYDFRKNIQKQSKDIASLERRIASLSGSTSAADIAERRKLEAELLDAREGLNDTYYEHSRDQQSQALDEEAEAFRDSKEKYIKELEKQLEDTETLIENSMMDVLLNADSIYAKLNGIADTYGITLSNELTQPWKDASAQAIAWKDELQESMTSGEYAALIGEGGTITAFTNGVATKLKGSWSEAQSAAQGYVDFLTKEELGSKFEKTITGFGDQIKNLVTYWDEVKNAADAAYTAQTREVTVGGNPNVEDDNSGGDVGKIKQQRQLRIGATDNKGNAIDTDIERLQAILNQFFGANLTIVGDYGPKTTAAVKTMQAKIGDIQDGLYTATTFEKLKTYLNKQPVSSWFTETGVYIPGGIKKRRSGGGTGNQTIHLNAKGTLGTKQDGWNITDESWIGEEITLAAGKNGQLQYLKKGSAVMPADISANLVEWGKINPNMFNVGSGANINMISNAVTKPEFNFDVENFLKVERVDKDTLPELEKMMDKKIDNLVRQLNYSIKKFK